MQYKVEDAIEDREDIMYFSKLCWEEVDQAKGVMEFDPDWEQYEILNSQGRLRHYTIYTDEGSKVGFAVFIVAPSLHCKGYYLASSDCMYIEKGYRGYGKEFLQLIEEDLREEGVHWFTFNAKAWLDSGSLAESLGCNLYEYVYQKGL